MTKNKVLPCHNKNLFIEGKSRMMGAGHASSSLYKCSPNLPTSGGSKKQGITSRVGLNNWDNREIQTQSNGIGRFKLHFMNQLSGIEPGHSMFGGRQNRADGLQKTTIEQKQIEENIQNQVILPRQSYSSGTNFNLTLKEETIEYFIFETAGIISGPKIQSILFNNVTVTVISNISKTDNKINVSKGTYTDIDTVNINIESPQPNQSGNYKWTRP